MPDWLRERAIGFNSITLHQLVFKELINLNSLLKIEPAFIEVAEYHIRYFVFYRMVPQKGFEPLTSPLRGALYLRISFNISVFAIIIY